jgi:DNA-binding transcriptional LysR family regulator
MIKDFEEMLCFAAVCKNGTFTEASALLGCSKSHVSKKVADLEKRLQLKLFYRTTRRIFLTEQGEALKADAINLFNEAKRFNHQASKANEQMSGNFVITTPVSLSTFLIAPLIPKLHKAFPDINFEIIPTNENLKIVEDGIDLAIRTSNVVDESLVAKHIADVKDVFITCSSNADKYKTLKLQDIAKVPFLINNVSSDNKTINVFDSGKPISLSPQNSVVVREFPVIANTLFGSDYVAWLPDYCEQYQQGENKLVRLLNSVAGAEWPIFIVFPFQTPLPLKLKSIMAFFQRELSRTFK